MNCPHCRAPLPPGSAYCNRCGAAATVPPGPQGHPFGPPAYSAPPETSRRPVLLLAVLVAAVLATTALAALFITRRNSGQSLIASQRLEAPAGPGVHQGGVTPLPEGPALTEGGVPVPPVGNPVTAGQPPKDGGMAPSMLLGPGAQAPSAPSVLKGRQLQIPSGPGIHNTPPPSPPNGGNVTSGKKNFNSPLSPPSHEAETPRNDRYLDWLRFVESERQKVHQAATNRMMEGVAGSGGLGGFGGGLGGFAGNPETMQYALRNAFVIYHQAMVGFWSNVGVPPVPIPSDCISRHQQYLSVKATELRTAAQVRAALGRNDLGAVLSAGRMSSRELRDKLKRADDLLADALEKRKLDRWYIDTGSSGFGEGFLGM